MVKSVTIKDEVYGKITLDNRSNIWKVKERVIIPINNKECEVMVEIDIYNSMYVKHKYELLSKELIEFNKKHPELLKEDYAIECEQDQKNIYQRLIIDNAKKTAENIEKAALEKLDEILADETEYLIAEVGKEKADKILGAKTKEKKLASLVLKRMRVFRDRIEITCTCDWFRHSGGFSINSDGYAVMLSLDSMSI